MPEFKKIILVYVTCVTLILCVIAYLQYSKVYSSERKTFFFVRLDKRVIHVGPSCSFMVYADRVTTYKEWIYFLPKDSFTGNISVVEVM